MSTTTVWSDGHFIANHVALDFANTVYRRTPELGADLLNTPEALTAWLTRAGLLPRPHHQPFREPDDALVEARALRALFWVTFDAQTRGEQLPADSLTGLLDVARYGSAEVTVHPDGSATPRTGPGALAALALRGLGLVLSPPARPVRSCDRCGWFFLDTSRGRQRRWCSMATCGNQAKAARHRAGHP